MTIGIYKITCKETGKFYIGQTSTSFNRRRIEHFSALRRNKHGNSHMQRVWNNHESLEFEPFVVCSADDLDKWEQSFLDLWCKKDPLCMNMCPTAGSARGCKMPPQTAEHKAKNSASKVGKKRTPHTEKTKAKISASLIGKKRSQDSIDKMLETRRLKDARNLIILNKL